MKAAYTIVLVLCLAIGFWNPGTVQAGPPLSIDEKFSLLEISSGARIGISALDLTTGRTVGYRSAERFPLCSTFKAVLAAAILDKSRVDPALMDKRIRFQENELVSWSPITELYLASGMTIAELCAAAVQFSDNTAANLLLKEVGGPEGLTAFARSLDDGVFRIDRWEPEMNSALPGDERDTSTPDGMRRLLGLLVLDGALGPEQRELLGCWLKASATGYDCIRSVVPAGWTVGDKTGNGSYGTSNDIAVIWPADGGPILMAVYTTHRDQNAPARKDLVAEAARIALDELAAQD